MANLKSINNVKKLPFLEQILFTVLWCVLSMYVVWKKSKKYVTHIFLIQSRAGIELHLAWQFDKDKLYVPFEDKNTIPTLYLIIGLIICYHYHKIENSLTWKEMAWVTHETNVLIHQQRENRWLGPIRVEVVSAK